VEGETLSMTSTTEPEDSRSGTAPRMRRVLARLLAGPASRMTEPASDESLDHVERALGAPLPPELRALLREVGSGLYERGHEVFGPSRVMIHDIELVPDMLSMRARLAGPEGAIASHLVPFHRGRGSVHLIRTGGPRVGEVVSLPPGATYADLPTFIEQVILTPAPG
jgi:hypothetical protein